MIKKIAVLVLFMGMSCFAKSEFGNFNGCSYVIEKDGGNGELKWFCPPGTKIEFVPVINGEIVPNLNGEDRYILIEKKHIHKRGGYGEQ
jgi:hypothetical protein